MDSHTIALLLLTLAVAQLVFTAFYLLLHHRRYLVANLIALFSACLACYLVGLSQNLLVELPRPVWATFIRMGNIGMLLIWLIAHFLFEDNRRIPPIVWLLGGYFLIARIFGFGFVPFSPRNEIAPPVYFFTHVLTEIIKVGFLLHSIFLIVKGYASDLSLTRRRLRIAVAGGIGLLTIFVTVNSSFQAFGRFLGSTSFSMEGSLLSLPYGDTPIPQAFFSAYIYIALNLFIIWKMRIRKDDAATILSSASELSCSLDDSIFKLKSNEAKLIARIKHAMEIDQVYKEPNLTIADLATRVQIPEYKVREIINTHMNFKNFRDFVNSYRISKTEEMLVNEDHSITYIGMDVGFVSLSAFYRIFKDKNNITPREFRIKNKR